MPVWDGLVALTTVVAEKKEENVKTSAIDLGIYVSVLYVCDEIRYSKIQLPCLSAVTVLGVRVCIAALQNQTYCAIFSTSRLLIYVSHVFWKHDLCMDCCIGQYF